MFCFSWLFLSLSIFGSIDFFESENQKKKWKNFCNKKILTVMIWWPNEIKSVICKQPKTMNKKQTKKLDSKKMKNEKRKKIIQKDFQLDQRKSYKIAKRIWASQNIPNQRDKKKNETKMREKQGKLFISLNYLRIYCTVKKKKIFISLFCILIFFIFFFFCYYEWVNRS